MRLRCLCLVTLAAVIAACTTAPEVPPRVGPTANQSRTTQWRPSSFVDLPGWTNDRQSAAWPAFVSGCTALTARSNGDSVWTTPCRAARTLVSPNDTSVRTFFETYFTPYRVSGPDGADSGLVTGYYEPLLNGSKRRSAKFRYPLYAPPDDLLTIDLGDQFPELKDKRIRGRVEGKRVVPYWTRSDIDAGRAPVSGKELVWVDDPLEAFFVQVQGSGRIQLAEGGVMRIGYGDQNGHPYRSIGRVLVDRGEMTLDQASMQSIKQWGRTHVDQLPALLDENPSYVFFREVPPNPAAKIDGPIGSLGVPLAAGRTIAVDTHFIPLGAPVFLATTMPLSTSALNRLVLAQDTGGAIRGAPRADLFWGFGDEPGQQAGRMKQDGKMWVLWPQGAALPN
jgi:membrane-bound lytic murein transglycosylase A